MGIFDKFKTAEVMGVRNYIKEGKHIFLIKRGELGPSKNPQHKVPVEKCVVELKVLHSEPFKAGGEAMKQGEMTALVEMDTSQGYAGNVLAFVAGVLGVTVDEMKADEDFEGTFGSVFGEEQIFAGMVVRCTAQQVGTTKGGEYTAKTWEPFPAHLYPEYGLVAPNGAYVDPAHAG